MTMMRIWWIWVLTQEMYVSSWNFMPTPPTKYCVNCKHFMIHPTFPTKKEFGKCRKFPLDHTSIPSPINVVSGEMIDERTYVEKFISCSNARSFECKCGPNAKEFVSNNQKTVPDTLPITIEKPDM